MPALRAWPSLVAALVVLLLAGLVAVGVGDALGLSYTPSSAPPSAPLTGRLDQMSPAPAITRIEAPADERITLAARAVADAVASRGLPTPTVAPEGGADLRVALVPPFAQSPEAFRVRSDADGRLTLEAAGPAGAAAGLYAVAVAGLSVAVVGAALALRPARKAQVSPQPPAIVAGSPVRS